MTEQKKADNQAQLMLSVIVPVYNVQEYLLDCMESIDAAIKNIEAEVLLIDDGSTDSSSEIAKAFLEEHHKFRYFHKENGGLAETRNFGISKASGKYLSFIDSDDLITEDMYEKMIASAEMHDADFTIINVARFNKKRIYDATLYVRMFNDVDETVTHISECGRLIYDTIVCNKLVRRDFWTENGFEFPVGWRFEDMAVMREREWRQRIYY
jgi:CDP-glycerol glycerophosphotransferase